jgi:hypothetical protein
MVGCDASTSCAHSHGGRPWAQLSQILIDTGDGVLRPLYREIADHASMPYRAHGPGTMTRDELEDAGLTDRQLEREVLKRFGVRLRLPKKRDTPRARVLRDEAHVLVIDAMMKGEARK